MLEIVRNEVYFVAFDWILLSSKLIPCSSINNCPFPQDTVLTFRLSQEDKSQSNRHPTTYPEKWLERHSEQTNAIPGCIYRRVKDVLKDLLCPEVERHIARPIPALKQLTPAQIVDGLKNQLNGWPFDLQVENNNLLVWWESLHRHPHAKVLAVCHNTVQ